MHFPDAREESFPSSMVERAVTCSEPKREPGNRGWFAPTYPKGPAIAFPLGFPESGTAFRVRHGVPHRPAASRSRPWYPKPTAINSQ